MLKNKFKIVLSGCIITILAVGTFTACSSKTETSEEPMSDVVAEQNQDAVQLPEDIIVEETDSEMLEDVNEQAEVEAIEETEVEEPEIPVDEWLQQVAKEQEWAKLAVWNEKIGYRKVVEIYEHRKHEGDEFAVIAPYEIGECSASVNIDIKIESTIEGNVAYIKIPDDIVADRFFAQVKPIDGIDLGPDVIDNSEFVHVYFEYAGEDELSYDI